MSRIKCVVTFFYDCCGYFSYDLRFQPRLLACFATRSMWNVYSGAKSVFRFTRNRM